MLLSSKCLRSLWVALSLATAATLLFVACGGTSPAPVHPGPTTQVQPSPTPSLTPVAVVNVNILQKDGKYVFDPAMLTVRVGTQVVWTNNSDAIHTVTSDTGVFNTDNLAAQQTYSVIFTKPGTYSYYCNIHLYMKGTIIVTP